MLLDKIETKIRTKTREKMGWRDIFALGIMKTIRSYLTKGKEDAILNDNTKQHLIKQKTTLVTGKSLLSVEPRYRKIQQGDPMAFSNQNSLFIEDKIDINHGVKYTTQAGTVLKPNGVKIEAGNGETSDATTSKPSRCSKRPSS